MNWFSLILWLLGGLTLFLFGMTIMTNGLKEVAGNRMKGVLSKMTNNRFKATLAGAGITAVIQSSSITSVLIVGFVSAGLLQFQNSLGIILGANIGTTITAQIIAFKVTSVAYLILVIGFIFYMLFPKKMIKNVGLILLGLGLVFLGMNEMGAATDPLKSYDPFLNALKTLNNPFLGILLGAVFTAIIQSSSATTGVVIMLASQSFINIEAGIALIIGANIGTCITVVLAAIGKPRVAMQVALAHVMFNVIGAFLWIGLIPVLAQFIKAFTPNDIARQIANAHTIFNISNAVILLGMVPWFSKLILFIIPVKSEADTIKNRFLNDYYLDNSSIAFEMVKQAAVQMGNVVFDISSGAFKTAVYGNQKELSNLRSRDVEIDQWQFSIIQFLQKIEQKQLYKNEVRQLRKLIDITNLLEAFADVVTTNLVETAQHRYETDFQLSKQSEDYLKQLFNTVITQFQQIYTSVLNNNDELALDNSEFKIQIKKIKKRLVERLVEQDEKRIEIYRFESELIEIAVKLNEINNRLVTMRI